MELIKTGNLEDNLGWAHKADWIVEAVLEDLEIKRRVMARIEEVRGKNTIVSTNTSGIPIHQIAEGRGEEFRAHFLGTHFFNPVRYLNLLELIPTSDTALEVVVAMREFGERRLGKKVVTCRDTPGFIANRVSVLTAKAHLNYVLQNGFTVEEVDALTGPLIGRPKTATFRLLDLIGMDTDKLVTSNLYESIAHDEFREELKGPSYRLTENMVQKGLLGNKASQGFYKRVEGPGGGAGYQVLDLRDLQYREQQTPCIPLVEEAQKIGDLEGRLKFLITQEDHFSRLVWHTIAFDLSYCSLLIPEIASTSHDLDETVKAGFSHEMGPFEIWDALGVADTVKRMDSDGFKIASWVREMLRLGAGSFNKREGRQMLSWNPTSQNYQPVHTDPEVLNLSDRRKSDGIIGENPGASLIDLGDDVLCLAFHSRGDAFDQDVERMCGHALERLEKDFVGLVLASQGRQFSLGADFTSLVQAAENGRWDVIEKEIRGEQELFMRLRGAPKPVVAAPYGMTLGRGAEICLAADSICASAETYLGFNEFGLGLLPSAGGSCEMIKRIVSPSMKMADTDALPLLFKAFQNVALSKVSESAQGAREMGFLSESDRIVMNGDHLLRQAKRAVIAMHEAGYVPAPPTKSVYALGQRGMAYLIMDEAQNRLWGHFITEHENRVARKLAYVMAGGALSGAQWVSEQYLLDLEREACLSLCGERETLDRIRRKLVSDRARGSKA